MAGTARIHSGVDDPGAAGARRMAGRKQLRLRVKRAYEPPASSDGYRVLVDRIWPRGVSKQDLKLDDWAKELAPSAGLRKWFQHDPAKWDAFRERYFRELDKQPAAIERLLARSRAATVTLVFGAREERFNDAVALKEYLERRAAQ